MSANRNNLSLLSRVVGNAESIRALLKQNDGTPFDLTGWAVAFRMVVIEATGLTAGAAVADNVAATIIDAATGSVGYTPLTGHVAVAGTYALYWIVTKGGEPTRRFPYDGARWLLILKAETDGT